MVDQFFRKDYRRWATLDNWLPCEPHCLNAAFCKILDRFCLRMPCIPVRRRQQPLRPPYLRRHLMNSRIVFTTLALATFVMIGVSSASADDSSCPGNRTNVGATQPRTIQTPRLTGQRQRWTMRVRPSRSSGFSARHAVRTFSWGVHERRY